MPHYTDPAVEAQMKGQELRGEAVVGTPFHLAILSAAKPSELEAATIPVENAHCAILLISGKDDQMWPSNKMAQMVMDRLAEHHYQYPYQHLAYEGAGHMIVPPYTPVLIGALHPVSRQLVMFGGNAKGYAYAFEDSWSKILKFLAQNLKK